jgi:hypothetical protein
MTVTTRPTAATTGTARRHDLDWLRAVVLADSFAVTAALCGLVGRARVLGPLLGARPVGGGR